MSENDPKKTPMPLFIGIAGKKQSGKNTVANLMANYLAAQGKTVEISAFADPLKEMCINILGLKREEVYGTDEDKNRFSHIRWDGFPYEVRHKYSDSEETKPRSGPMTNREVLQVVGSDIFREIDINVWANAPFQKPWNADVVILADCRFPNEVKAIEQHNGHVVRIVRDNLASNDHHKSETALDNEQIQFVIPNNGTLETLQNWVQALIKRWFPYE